MISSFPSISSTTFLGMTSQNCAFSPDLLSQASENHFQLPTGLLYFAQPMPQNQLVLSLHFPDTPSIQLSVYQNHPVLELKGQRMGTSSGLLGREDIKGV